MERPDDALSLSQVAWRSLLAFLVTFGVLIAGHEAIFGSLKRFSFWEECLTAALVAFLYGSIELVRQRV